MACWLQASVSRATALLLLPTHTPFKARHSCASHPIASLPCTASVKHPVLRTSKSHRARTATFASSNPGREQATPDSLQEAKHVLSRIIRAGEDVEKVIRQFSRKGKIDEVLMRVLDARLQLAKEEDEAEVVEGLELLRARLVNELQRCAARPGLRLLDELMHMDEDTSTSVEARNRKVVDRMLKAFGMQSRGVDILAMSSSIAQGKAVDIKAEQVTREEFVDAVDELLEEVRGFEAELAKAVAGNGRSFSDVDVEARRSLINRVQEFKSIAVSLDESLG